LNSPSLRAPSSSRHPFAVSRLILAEASLRVESGGILTPFRRDDGCPLCFGGNFVKFAA